MRDPTAKGVDLNLPFPYVEGTCQGDCGRFPSNTWGPGECRGHVRRVHVRDKKHGTDWGQYLYCQAAVDHDLKTGLDVEELP